MQDNNKMKGFRFYSTTLNEIPKPGILNNISKITM